ncbi:hypothetical protein CHUAL_009901 [Chamberlinius hualienensis]
MKIIIVTTIIVSFYTLSISAHQIYKRQNEVAAPTPNTSTNFMDMIFDMLGGSNSPIAAVWPIVSPMFTNLLQQFKQGASGEMVVTTIHGVAGALQLFAVPLSSTLGVEVSDSIKGFVTFLQGSMCLEEFIDLVLPSLFGLVKLLFGQVLSTGLLWGNNIIGV